MSASPSDIEEITSETTSDELMSGINHKETIEAVISTMDQDQKVMFGENEGGSLWKFCYGSVEVFVQLTGETDEDSLTVWSFILPLPAKNEVQLMRKLLEMNWTETFESRFCIVNNQVAVVASRTLAEISPGEISRAITVVATIADNNDDALKAEFGAA
ncbi:YbjN domain-containing protein [Merismopedia glauca]|uniref:YbjN domain-containing protein n=1 Tax=Merismopedia glauca CCAP 1448/3 TaxID=1296344 RepID=A0A2T1C979_9CYAN|nr:YbjN domain-containing protein [Merismopedia glauca]PSB04794.1 YbjN domain-containing protein [Merismopedia glauca CCAP 1448/3]